jgi:3-deoxy-manno-octulosonate cytidylyltransferase (CMP-KDO synthetase)
MNEISSRCCIIIPARLASTRLPEKLLLRAGGKSVLQHTYEAALRATVTHRVIIAVDNQKLAAEVENFGGHFVMTSPNCPSGTDRLADVARSMPNIEVFVNVQGDEPEIDPHAIDQVARTLIDHPDADIATVAKPIRERSLLNDPARVKIAVGQPHSDGTRTALYFSRSVIPYVRSGITDGELQAEPPVFWHHLGLYAYRRDFLAWFAAQPPGHLEQLERLEQLRALEAGRKIVVTRVEFATPGIDTLEDFQAFTARITARR